MSTKRFLYVEGRFDVSVVKALLLAHDVNLSQQPDLLKVEGCGGDAALLAQLDKIAPNCLNAPTGIVLDIDASADWRWGTITEKLAKFEYSGFPASWDTQPNRPQHSGLGFCLTKSDWQMTHSFGVWLMPDGRSENQTIEHFIEPIFARDQNLWEHSSAVLEGLEAVDPCRFHTHKRLLAQILTWKAWQSDPRAPYGDYIHGKVLKLYEPGMSPTITAFLRWLRDLYGLPIQHLN